MRISVSLLACPQKYLFYSSLFSAYYADSIHVDIMDGVCVPLTGVSYNNLLEIAQLSTLPIQVHLMVHDQMAKLERILSILTVDTVFLTIEKEPVELTLACLRKIRHSGRKAAIALWPETDIAMIGPFLSDIEKLLVMTAKAGTPQSMFLQTSYSRIQSIVSYLNQKGASLEIVVDGGMNAERLIQMEQLRVLSAVVGRSFFIPEELMKIERLRTPLRYLKADSFL